MLIRLRWDLLAELRETNQVTDAGALEALGGHSAYWKDHSASGRVLLSGAMDGSRWDDVALIVFKAGSLAEASEVVEQDPAVRARVFRAEVRPIQVFFAQGDPRPSVEPETR